MSELRQLEGPILQEANLVPLDLPAPKPPNRFLLAYRGHGRQWQEPQLITLLEFLEAGHSISKAADLAGIPRRSVYDIAERDPQFKEAVAQVHTREGSDWWEDQLR